MTFPQTMAEWIVTILLTIGVFVVCHWWLTLINDDEWRDRDLRDNYVSPQSRVIKDNDDREEW